MLYYRTMTWEQATGSWFRVSISGVRLDRKKENLEIVGSSPRGMNRPRNERGAWRSSLRRCAKARLLVYTNREVSFHPIRKVMLTEAQPQMLSEVKVVMGALI